MYIKLAHRIESDRYCFKNQISAQELRGGSSHAHFKHRSDTAVARRKIQAQSWYFFSLYDIFQILNNHPFFLEIFFHHSWKAISPSFEDPILHLNYDMYHILFVMDLLFPISLPDCKALCGPKLYLPLLSLGHFSLSRASSDQPLQMTVLLFRVTQLDSKPIRATCSAISLTIHND